MMPSFRGPRKSGSELQRSTLARGEDTPGLSGTTEQRRYLSYFSIAAIAYPDKSNLGEKERV